LARVSIVNFALQPLYDAYVLPPPGVSICDYRTRWSGITAWHLHSENSVTKPKTFEQAQADVAALLKDRVLVGHALKNDLDVLGISHPRRDIRDTSRHAPFRALGAATPGGKGRTPSLKRLAEEILGQRIQGDEVKGHSSVEDAKAAMELFRKEKKSFEREHQIVWGRDGRRGPKEDKIGKSVIVDGEKAVEVKMPAKAQKGRPVNDNEDSEEDDVDEDSDDEDDDDDEDLGSYDEDEEATATKTKAQPKKKKKKKKKSRTKRA
jgi:RNA exonuclease 4